MASFANHDLSRPSLTVAFQHGFESGFIASYEDHFVALNPWLDYWATVPDGFVGISERDSPAHLFRDTEFYSDWIAPQGNADAAVGMSFNVDPHNTIQIAWHYASANAPKYDDVAAAILETLKPAIREAVRSQVLLRDGLVKGVQAGSLIEHISGIAMILDDGRALCDANEEATAELRRDRILSSSSGAVSFKAPAAQRWLEETVFRLRNHFGLPSTDAVFSFGDLTFKASLVVAPFRGVGDADLLLPPRTQFLLVVKILVGGEVALDVDALQTAFGLSAAETKLCEMLVNGASLSDAARRLEISDGTVRQRIKMIFGKTGTHRQGALVALLARFRFAR